MRFDSFSIVVSNSLFILLSIIPVNAFFSRTYQLVLKWIYFVTNAVFISVNFIDAGYFPFIRKRSNYDLIKQVGGQTDLGKLLPLFVWDFWWIILLYLILLAGMVFLYNLAKIKTEERYARKDLKSWPLAVLLFLLTSALAVLGARGGMQRIPIDIVNAASMTKSEEVPIVLNTPFTLIKSIDRKSLEDYRFFDEARLNKIYSPIHHFKDSTFLRQNVVVVILESFSKEYTRLGKKHSITPFLDSLMDKSLVFTNAYSNGIKSIEGIPSILSSLPSLMENPYINSIYANNRQTTFASILKKEGYQTAFFHGGINGTMNFDDWAASAGYGQYFGKKEYNNNDDFDNFWGIWDEPFLQYSVKKINEFKEPFHTAIFTLSSHHPYFIPDKYKTKFAKGSLENSECIEYADFALKQFFSAAKKMAWYPNTLFILSADHASLSDDRFFSNVVGNQSIPVLFFRPDNSLARENPQTFSQMDILPSALELLGYNKPFFSFGQSYLSKKDTSAYFYSGGVHYVCNDSMIFTINNNKLIAAHNYRRDSLLQSNVLGRYPAADAFSAKKFRAFIQSYNHTLINNTGTAE